MNTIYFENPITGEKGSAVLSKVEGVNTLTVQGEEATKNFTLLTGVKDIIVMAVKSESEIHVGSFGDISEQEQCNLDIGQIPLGTFSNEFPLMANQTILTFKQTVAPANGRPGKYVLDKYLGEVVAIDAR